MRRETNYRGYTVWQSILDRRWYADRVNAMTTEESLSADSAAGLRALIDDATAGDGQNPWELPMRGAVAIAA